MNFLAVICGVFVLGIAAAVDVAPTNVVVPQVQTIPPSDGGHERYVETVYKATDHKTQVHTVEPLQPSYEVRYQETSVTTVNNQTISTSSADFATVLNTTVLYFTDGVDIYTYNAAPTYYQTLDFTSQKVMYTPISATATTSVEVIETNALPFV